MQDSNQPAFPVTEDHGVNSAFPGITIRDYFAAKALVGLIHRRFPLDAAQEAYEYADAMLKARQGE
jgi:hypothetical protein